MSKVLEEAKSLIQNHSQLHIEEEELINKIQKEEDEIYPKIIKLMDSMTPEEFQEFYRSISDSDLKYRIFTFVKKKSGM